MRKSIYEEPQKKIQASVTESEYLWLVQSAEQNRRYLGHEVAKIVGDHIAVQKAFPLDGIRTSVNRALRASHAIRSIRATTPFASEEAVQAAEGLVYSDPGLGDDHWRDPVSKLLAAVILDCWEMKRQMGGGQLSFDDVHGFVSLKGRKGLLDRMPGATEYSQRELMRLSSWAKSEGDSEETRSRQNEVESIVSGAIGVIERCRGELESIAKNVLWDLGKFDCWEED